MDDMLLEIVMQRLDAVPLPDEASALLLVALDSDQALSAQLSADPGTRQIPTESSGSAVSPVGAFLRSVAITGFRGIGSTARLDVMPGPGLTLVVGRNGSGKSSFAEAAEVLLTGTLMRWAPPAPAVVRDGWRNKHAADTAEIQAEFLVEDSGEAVITRSWPTGADLGSSTAWLQRRGEKRGAISELGWDDALSEYRPFLSHAELEAFFGRPSELHDLLASVLGLDDLAIASSRLNVARKQREDALAAVRQRLEPLRGRLMELDDERARACLAALAGRSWDIAAAKSAATGADLPDGGQLEALRRLTQLSVPAGTDVTGAAASLREAAVGLEQMVGTAAGQALTLAQLLEAALQHQRAHGDGDCPVCGRPKALTAQWRTATQEHIDRLRREARTAQAAAAVAVTAAEQALALMQPAPAILGESAISGLDLQRARDAWKEWATRPPSADLAAAAGLRALADHLELALAPLTDAVSTLSAEASKELSRRGDQWAPVAAEVASWCADAAPAWEAVKPVASIKQARAWLVSATTELRNARLAPLADQARAIWGMLRQESNVDLGAFRLAGTATQRKLELDVSIDGEPGAALGVMSQGEINALALSIFLPRATMPQSPFRFLIIDDPVQAMDPAKVDGLARVLEQVAADRQVIVFTHDNRLAAAVQDLTIPATVLEVTRRPRSVVQVRRCLDPVEQALKDAGALNADRAVPATVAMRVIPGLCRSAIEAELTQAVWRRQLRTGRTRDEIEAELTDARRRFTNLAALAMFGDADQGSGVLSRLSRQGSPFADTFQALNRGAHQAHTGDLGQLIADTRRLAGKLHDILP
jgi:recombinational DNA repair ATPase RecF